VRALAQPVADARTLLIRDTRGMAQSFAVRFAHARDHYGPLVLGADPHASVLEKWGLADTPDGLERFIDIVLAAAKGTVGLVKPQSAFYERHGWPGIRALTRLVESARRDGILVILDVKRGDVGSTNDAYAQAYLGAGAAIEADAITVHPYLGLAAMGAFVDRAQQAGACLLVVTRSSNPEGRAVQAARVPTGTSVEQQLLDDIGALNARLAPGAIGPVGAVIGPAALDPPLDLTAANALFLAPGVGAQGAAPADVARTFAAGPDRVMPAASRSLLAAGPDHAALADAAARLNDQFRALLQAPADLSPRPTAAGELTMSTVPREFRQVDVFTDKPCLGNPVAVVHEAAGLSDDEMQLFARWTNLSETTYLLPPRDERADYRVRIFTPTRELPFAGHPTLGTCHAWLEAGGHPVGPGVIVQECEAGLVTVRQTGDRLAFAAPPLVRGGPVEESLITEIAAILGIKRDDITDAQWADNGPGWVAVMLSSAAAVLEIAQPECRFDLGVVGPYPPGSPEAFEVRAFFPKDGKTAEDPVTGSLNAALAQWLLGSGQAQAPYVASQGTALGRRGRVYVSTDDNGDIWIGGGTLTLITGSTPL
jgi:orotidine 5'-phosphate decarboxylase subfamily 2